jgi:hypothetical protein
MSVYLLRRLFLRAALAALAFPGPRARAATEATRYASQAVTFGSGGFLLNFDVLWSCDDVPLPTTSAPGRIDLLDGTGALVASVVATIGNGLPIIRVHGAGTLSGARASVLRLGAGGTPADAFLHATWRIVGPAPGLYTLRFWFDQEATAGFPLSTITTRALDAGGSGPLGGPGPAAPPSVSLSAPPAATAFLPALLAATATAASGGSALSSVSIDASLDGGTTWTPVVSDSRPSSPSDGEAASFTFRQAGTATVRATAVDASGLRATDQKAFPVAKANQPAIVLTPSSAAVAQGQSVGFTASGGATGAYAWGGSASGSGTSQTVPFPTAGAYAVTAYDVGNAAYNPSPSASAAVTVQAALFTLSVSSAGAGTVSGGGAYPPDSVATAVATAAAGNTFVGWTGDATSASASVSLLMNADKAILAHFTPLLAQTITLLPPGPLTTKSPAVALGASASSGLPVTLTLDSGPATLAGAWVSPSGIPGLVTVTATQPGDAVYLPAPPVTITFPIGPPPPGVLLSDDSALTKKSDRETRTTSFRSVSAH